MERLSEEIQSVRNRLFWKLREKIRFRRSGYAESAPDFYTLQPEARQLAAAYNLPAALSPEVIEKNCATLFILEKMLGDLPLPSGRISALEVGCQDFARLPALQAYLAKRKIMAEITGIEVDAFPLLDNLHSRADKAAYYIGVTKGSAKFVPADFFRWSQAAHLTFSFYPFVSANPALAWGLPKEFGDPKPWVNSFVRNLQPGGLLLIVHQGPWEEEDFDEARLGSPLTLLKRENADCPFYPLPHPACASVYTLS
jgi:hypothetical protein